jgi:integrase
LTSWLARQWLRAISCDVCAYAIDIGLRADDPTLEIKMAKPKSGGFHTWSEDDIAAFLLLHTAQRRADVLRMGRQRIRDGVLSVRQQKTGALLAIPVTPPLAAVLDATPSDHLTFLVIDRGQPFEPAAFTKWFRRCCDAAGLPKTCRRTDCARRLAADLLKPAAAPTRSLASADMPA